MKSRRLIFPYQNAVALGALFGSGSAALMYELCWIRKASLVFGSTTFALSTVIAVFFLGLALGSYVFGKWAHRIERPLLWFAILEAALGLFALATPWIFHIADVLYGVVYRAAPERPWILGIARTGLVGSVILPATTIMGATLPLFCRRYAGGVVSMTRGVGFLYGLNTLGAAVGAAAAGFVLLPSIGLERTLQFAAGISLCFGLTVAFLPMARMAAGGVRAVAKPETTVPAEGGRGFSLLLYFGVGFVGLGLQVVWYRFLSLVIRDTVIAYTMVLTTVLAGIVIGSWVAAALAAREGRVARVFGAIQICFSLTVIGLMSLPAETWRSVGGDLWICALLLLVPSVLGGASFPLAARLAVVRESAAALGAGLATAANTLGGVLGILLLGFLVIPYWGLQGAIVFATGFSLLIGAAAWLWLDLGVKRSGRYVVPAVAASLWTVVALFGPVRVPADFLVEGEDVLLDYREGFGANLAAVRYGDAVHLEIDRWWQGEDRKNHQAAAAHIPALLHPDPTSVLVVGTGQTASRFLMHDIERLHCVDIEPLMFDFVRRNFESAWMDDPRTALIVEDGRTYLRHARASFDIISLELGQVFRPGVAYFYTREAYESARRRLAPGGLLVQFVPLPFFDTERFRSVVGTFLEVFPQSVLWYNTSEVLLIGPNAGAFPWRTDLSPEPPWSETVVEDLDLVYWGGPADALNRPEVFLGGFLAGPEELTRFAGSGRRLRDDLPVLDYATAGRHALEGNEIRIAERLRGHLTPLAEVVEGEWDPGFVEAVTRIQERNLADIAASALLRQAEALSAQGRPAAAGALLAEALEWNPGNLEANIRFGENLRRSGRRDGALVYFRRAAEIHPADVRALSGLAIMLHQTGHPEEAVPHYRRALELNPDDAELHNNLGAALAEGGEMEIAAEHFAKAVRLRPDHAEAVRNLRMARRVLEVFEPE